MEQQELEELKAYIKKIREEQEQEERELKEKREKGIYEIEMFSFENDIFIGLFLLHNMDIWEEFRTTSDKSMVQFVNEKYLDEFKRFMKEEYNKTVIDTTFKIKG